MRSVILGIGGERIDGPRDLARKVAALGPGKKTDLIYWHDGSEKTASVKLGSLTDDKEARVNPGMSRENNAFSGLGLTLAHSKRSPKSKRRAGCAAR